MRAEIKRYVLGQGSRYAKIASYYDAATPKSSGPTQENRFFNVSW